MCEKTKEIKVLVVGLDPYPGKKDYGPLKIEGYCFPTVAFIPKLNDDTENKKQDYERLYNIRSYRRVMSFLVGKALTKKEFTKYDDVKNVAFELAGENIYLGNITEMDISKIKHKLNEKSRVIIFGVATKREWDKQIKKSEEILNCEIVFFHHPSPQVHHEDWKKYDYEMQQSKSPKVDLKNVDNHMPTVNDIVKNIF